ncbi:MAG TPA: co-chaperone GroES [Nitrospiria bacterium]
MKLRPLHDWALIRPKPEVEKSAGGIVIPDLARKKPHEGEVLAIGPGRFKEERDKHEKVTDRKFVPSTVKTGDHVLYEKYGTSEVVVNGEDLVMVREESILGWVA